MKTCHTKGPNPHEHEGGGPYTTYPKRATEKREKRDYKQADKTDDREMERK
jgi:hypothetical protein